MENMTPSNWFREKLQQWEQDLKEWHVKHIEFKDPSKKAMAQTLGSAMSKAKGPPPGGMSKARPAEKSEENGQSDGKEDGKADANKDPLDELEEEMDKEDGDVFSLDDVCDMKDGNATPLFSNFVFEDWALLSLRFELHLLVHAVKRETNDPDKPGVPPDEVAGYYTKYYKKTLNPKNYGVDSVENVLELVKDTAITGRRSEQVEPMISDDLAYNDVFVRLTEECRRDRKRRVDAGEEGAALKFPRPSGSSVAPDPDALFKGAAVSKAPGGLRPPGPFTKSFTKAPSKAAPDASWPPWQPDLGQSKAAPPSMSKFAPQGMSKAWVPPAHSKAGAPSFKATPGGLGTVPKGLGAVGKSSVASAWDSGSNAWDSGPNAWDSGPKWGKGAGKGKKANDWQKWQW